MSRSTALSPPSTTDIDTDVFKTEMIALIPYLRAFAHSLSGRHGGADDLAQDTLVKAWQARDRFEPGTNLKAWLFTILRNQYYSTRRRAWREAPFDSERACAIPGADSQIWAAELSDTARALQALAREQREALILVGAGGFSYEEAAQITNCALGTIKSRVARARKTLIAILDGAQPLPSSDRSVQEGAVNSILAQLAALSPASSIDSAESLGVRRDKTAKPVA